MSNSQSDLQTHEMFMFILDYCVLSACAYSIFVNMFTLGNKILLNRIIMESVTWPTSFPLSTDAARCFSTILKADK